MNITMTMEEYKALDSVIPKLKQLMIESESADISITDICQLLAISESEINRARDEQQTKREFDAYFDKYFKEFKKQKDEERFKENLKKRGLKLIR